MNFLLVLLVILSIVQFSYNSCININTDIISSYFNTSFSKECYDYVIQNDKDCCNNFLVNTECIDIYSHCNNYNDYIIDGIHDICHSHNTNISNISYSDYCHKFVLNIEPYCCKNISSCINWYTNCATNFTNTNTSTCDIPTRFTSEECTNYTLDIDPNCCNYFNDHCTQIYNWCLQNSPSTTSILDLFLPPQIGFILGTTLTTYTDIPNIYECLQICVNNRRCLSLNYNKNLQYCHLTRHVLEDHVNNQIIHLNNDFDYVYYEKKLKMPNPNNNCNVRNPSLLGDSICDHTGGYNSIDCDYDGGDCCKESCITKDFTLFCGITGYNCIDPFYTKTIIPSISPTELIDTNPPTHIPTYDPTHIPTYDPTYSPTRVPTYSPSTFPTNVFVEESRIITNNNNNNNQGVIIVLMVLLCLVSIMFIGYVIRDRKYNKLKLRRSQSVTFHNPMYNSSTNSTNHVDRIVYDDVDIDDESYQYDELGNTYSDVNKDKLPIVNEVEEENNKNIS